MATIQITVTTRVGVSVDTSPKPLLRDDGKTKIGGLLVVGEHLVFAKDIIAGSSAQTVVNPVVTLTYLADQDSLFLSDDRSQLKFVDTDGNRHAVRIDGDAQVGLVIADGFEGEEQAEEQEPEVAPRRQARQAKPAASAGRSRRAAPESEPEFDDGDDPESEPEFDDGDDPESEPEFDDGDDPEGDDPEGDDPEGDDPEDDDGEPLFDGDELADIAEEPAPRRQAARAPAKPQGRPAQRQPAGKPAQRRPARQQDADDIDLADLFE